jgi:hypothetical protein
MGHTEMECKMRSERWEDGKEWENGMFEFFDLTMFHCDVRVTYFYPLFTSRVTLPKI